jgi:outer membrane biosynthesis protein TonB
MTSSQTATRPSLLIRCAIAVLAMICALAFAQSAEAKAVKSSDHGRPIGTTDRIGKKKTAQARASRTKHRHGKEQPAPEGPTTTEPTPTPTPTPTESPSTGGGDTTTPTEPAPEPAPAPAPSPEPAPEPTPSPTPTEEPAPAPSGKVLFLGDQIKDFWLNQSAPSGMTEAADPAGSGQKVFKMTVSDADVYPVTPTENPRAQVLSPPAINSGEEIWWSSKIYLPGSFPSSVPGWLNLLEGPYGGPFNGSPPWQIQVVGNSIQWTRNKTYAWDVPWKMPLVKEKWINVVVHERFGSSGFVEMWINGQPITFFAGGTYNPSGVAATTHLNMATMDSSNNGGANSIILQSYRKAGMFSSVTVFEGPLTIGTSRSAVGG